MSIFACFLREIKFHAITSLILLVVTEINFKQLYQRRQKDMRPQKYRAPKFPKNWLLG